MPYSREPRGQHLPTNPFGRARLGRPGGVGIFVLILLATLLQPTQAEERGLPFISWYPPEAYAAGTQNWAITQGQDGIMFFGNDSVILKFDGARWERIAVAPGRAIRSLATAPDGRILVGSQGEFGTLEVDSSGVHHYQSLLDALPDDTPSFADVWQVTADEHYWYFSSSQALFRHADGQIEVFNHGEVGAGGSFMVHGQLFTDSPRGLLRLSDDGYKPVDIDDPQLHIYAMLPASDGQILIGTRQRGLFLFDPEQATLRAVAAEASAWLSEHQIYHGGLLPDGRYALATLRGGVAIVDLVNDEWETVGLNEGLPDVRVRHVRPDDDGGLWLALDSGLARIELQSPITRWNERLGLDGPVLSLVRFEGRLYAGTTLGLKILEAGGFEPVDGIDSEVWDLHVWTPAENQRHLLAATSYGVYEVNGRQAQLYSEPYLSMSLAHVPQRPDRLWVATYDRGLGYIDAAGNGAETQFTAIKTPGRTLTVDHAGMLWLTTWLDGVMRLDPDYASLLWQFPAPDSEQETTGLSVLVNDQHQLITSRTGIWQWLDHGDLVSREDLRPLLAEPLTGSAGLVESRPGMLWSIATDGITHRVRLARPDRPYDAHPVDALLGRLPDVEFYVIYPDGDEQIWIGGSDSLYRIDLARPVVSSNGFRIRWHSIRAGDRLLTLDTDGEERQLNPGRDFPLRFEYAAPSYDWPAGNQFRYRLTPLQAEWSGWSSQPYREFNHLPHGQFRFEVQARNVYGQTDTSSPVELRVPPPWYLDTVNLWLAGALILAMFPMLIWLGGMQQARRNTELEALVSDRTAELREQQVLLKHERDRLHYLSRHDELTGLANRRHGKHRLEEACEKASREGGAVALALLDVDHFKLINDHHGHDLGDRVLVELSRLLKQHCRPEDLVARWGGEEFLLLFPDTSLPDAAAVCHRIRDLVVHHQWSELCAGLTVSVSVGLTASRGQHPPARLLTRADELLYIAKRAGRDRIETDRENW